MSDASDRPHVLIAGIAGASLGTELLKSLAMTGRYHVHGCDISPTAFGHFAPAFESTAVVEREAYVDSVLTLCRTRGIKVILPGGQEPLVLLSAAAAQLAEAGVLLAANSTRIVSTFADKQLTFDFLREIGVSTPETIFAATDQDVDRMRYPCIVKTASGSGGSSFVFLAETADDARFYVSHLTRNGRRALLQEYVAHDEGEFTVGVLSLPSGRLVGSIALRRVFDAKLSVLMRTNAGLISTGYSQGVIDEFPAVRSVAEHIALAAGSVGPLNVQGRVRDGQFLPFEINPRFSASTYLRALAGFNEVDLFLRALLFGEEPVIGHIRPGYYLRSLTEVFAPLAGTPG